MLSGRQTLASLDDGMRQLHDTVQDMDQQVRESSSALMELQRKQSEHFKRMAQIRLDEVVSNELGEGLSLADRQARELIRKRAAKLGAVNKQVKAARAQLAGLEEQRGAASQDCERAEEALDRAEAKTQQRLADNSAYQEQLEKPARRSALRNTPWRKPGRRNRPANRRAVCTRVIHCSVTCGVAAMAHRPTPQAA